MGTALLFAALALALIHFATPLAYYAYAKRWLKKPWGVKNGPYAPKVTVIVPTYNEAALIAKKLEDIYAQGYPHLEVIIVDSASTDGTPEIAEKWARERRAEVKVIREERREGKAKALNNALRHAQGEVVVITDADSLWEPNALRNALAWLADPAVGAVTCLKKPAHSGPAGVEKGYRDYYNAVRIAESKLWSTTIFHGELAAFKKEALIKAGGFPQDIGADDSGAAAAIMLAGYRAIAPDDVWCVELIPDGQYHKWRIRRAQHLIQHFAKLLPHLPRVNPPYRKAAAVEAYLHLANPWLFPTAAALAALSGPPGYALLALGAALLAVKPYRTWITTQAYLIAAAIKNLYNKEIIWQKQEKPTHATAQTTHAEARRISPLVTRANDYCNNYGIQ